MSNPTFSAATASPPPDPHKHVNYTQGMVLGVDDFTQEFAYLSNRDQWLAREAIGYGTVSGLHVALEEKNGDIEVSVSPGVAINPRGQFIRVTPRQCARIGAWLALPATRTKLTDLGLSASTTLTAYVVLCYRDCPTDNLPVPGEPCRCDSDTMAPSRILDDFRLELTLTPPPQLEEDAVRDLIAWLREVEVADFNPVAGALEAFLQAIRDALGGITSPPQSPPDFFYGSPPAGLRIPRRRLCEWMRAAMRLWVTELRPLWQAQCAPKASCGCAGPCGCHGTGAEPSGMACECLLLAAVSISRSGATVTGASLDEDRRPFLVHLRMLQELLLCGPNCCEGCGDCRTFATVFAVDRQTLRIWIHHPVALELSEVAVSLQLAGVPVHDFMIAPVSPNVFDLMLPGSPLDTLDTATPIELEFNATLIHEPDGRDLATAIWQDGYCYADYSEPRLRVFAVSGSLVELAGDVVGPPAQNELRAIQGDPLNLAGLGDQQVLGFDSGQWHPVALPTPDDAALVVENTFSPGGNPPDPGNSANFARADHTHGLPPDPIPPHTRSNSDHLNHQIDGDVTGTLRATKVVKLQGVPINGIAPNDDEVLQFDLSSGEWMPARGDFVEHPRFKAPDEGRYFIVAAGILRDETVTPSYNTLRIHSVIRRAFVLTYGGDNPASPVIGYIIPGDHTYIVKGTSLGEIAGVLHVEKFTDEGIVVRLVGVPEALPREMMIEISLFGFK